MITNNECAYLIGRAYVNGLFHGYPQLSNISTSKLTTAFYGTFLELTNQNRDSATYDQFTDIIEEFKQ